MQRLSLKWGISSYMTVAKVLPRVVVWVMASRPPSFFSVRLRLKHCLSRWMNAASGFKKSHYWWWLRKPRGWRVAKFKTFGCCVLGGCESHVAHCGCGSWIYSKLKKYNTNSSYENVKNSTKLQKYLLLSWKSINIEGFKGIRQCTADKLMYIPIDDTHIYPFCRLQIVSETFGHSTKCINQWKFNKSPQSC